MKDGLLPVVAATGGVAAVLLWSMSVHDPYWRLFETPSVPAPAYEAPKDLVAVLASRALEYGNNDAGAISPPADPLASDMLTNIPLDTITREAEAPAIPETMIALVPPLDPEPMTGPAIEQMIAYRMPHAAIPAPAAFEPDMDLVVVFAPMPLPVALRNPGASAVAQAVTRQTPDPFNAPAAPALPRVANSALIEYSLERAGQIDVPHRLALAGFEPDTDLVVAFAPMPLPLLVALHDPDAGAIAQAVPGQALDPFNATAALAQPRVVASEFTENELALERAGRIDVQRRLALAGFDPSGFDGTFGPRTRGAIADFQTAWGFPATGYLETSVHADLNQRTEDAYQALRRQAAAGPSAAPKLAPIARERQFASAEDDNRCARRSDGRIIERQSLGCDLAGFTEQFVSLGRNILNYEDGGDTVETAAHTPFVPVSGVDR
jgi:hypothetical protein